MLVLPSVSTPEQNRLTTQCHMSMPDAAAGRHDRQFPANGGRQYVTPPARQNFSPIDDKPTFPNGSWVGRRR
jgi:hypothetical protein